MKTINNSYSNTIIIKNSQFICYLFPIYNTNIDSCLEEVRCKHPKATHYCYAYIYDDVKHSSDDGEPGGTAGMPILNVLEKENLNHVVCIVVRYFGGIKLGAGGLVRAYTKSVTETLKISNFSELVLGYKISLQFNYDDEKNILYILGNSVILNKEYMESINYICLVDSIVLDKLNNYKPMIIEELYIEKLN